MIAAFHVAEPKLNAQAGRAEKEVRGKGIFVRPRLSAAVEFHASETGTPLTSN